MRTVFNHCQFFECLDIGRTFYLAGDEYKKTAPSFASRGSERWVYNRETKTISKVIGEDLELCIELFRQSQDCSGQMEDLTVLKCIETLIRQRDEARKVAQQLRDDMKLKWRLVWE